MLLLLVNASIIFVTQRGYFQSLVQTSYVLKGIHIEAAYIETVFNWHVASDSRGASQLTRSKYNYKMLNFILDELMPWHEHMYDFSLLKVN